MIDTQTLCYASEFLPQQLAQTRPAPTAEAPVLEGRPSFSELLTEYAGSDASKPEESFTFTNKNETAERAGQETDGEQDVTGETGAELFARNAPAALPEPEPDAGTPLAETDHPVEESAAQGTRSYDGMAERETPAEITLTGNESGKITENAAAEGTDTAAQAAQAAADNHGEAGQRESAAVKPEDAALAAAASGEEADTPHEAAKESETRPAQKNLHELAAAETLRDSKNQGGFSGNSGGGAKENSDRNARNHIERTGSRAKAVKVEVRDVRTESGGVQHIEELTKRGGESGAREVELVVELKGAGQSAAGDTARHDPSQGAFRAEKSLENFLARELHQNLNGDIVRQAQVMLRNGGEGTIRLALHPQSLGAVKIRLELADNRISGAIIVETPEALRAFEQERANLEESFRASGFTEANLDTSLAGDGKAGGEQQNGGREARTLTAGIAAARYEDGALQDGALRYYAQDAGAGVDVLA